MNVDVPTRLGVPENAPARAENFIPAGSAPRTIDHVFGAMTPSVASRTEKARPTLAAFSARVAIPSFGANVSVTSAVAVKPSKSTTVSFTGNEPATEGLPVSSPVAPSIAIPSGRLAADHV